MIVNAKDDPYDVVYVLFRDARAGNVAVQERLNGHRLPFLQRSLLALLDAVVRVLPPFPSMCHCELLLLDGNGSNAHFATYASCGAGWQAPGPFYTQENPGMWRAFPVHMGRATAATVRAACDEECGSPYGFRLYVYTLPPLSSVLPLVTRDEQHDTAICSSLVARVLKRAACRMPFADRPHAIAWKLRNGRAFSPSRLYSRLRDTMCSHHKKKCSGSLSDAHFETAYLNALYNADPHGRDARLALQTLNRRILSGEDDASHCEMMLSQLLFRLTERM